MNTTEIKKALEALGYDAKHFKISTLSYHRWTVWDGAVWFGIYDLDKHTFVD